LIENYKTKNEKIMKKPSVSPIIALTAALAVSQMTFVAVANEEAAKEAYKDGVALFDQRDFTGAAAKFRQAYDLKPAWKVLYNVGQSEAAAKRHGLALEAFETYLSEGGDEVPDARREEVMAEVERLRKMIGVVEITADKGAMILVDGVERGKAPLLGKIPVSAGVKHTAQAIVDGQQVAQRDFKVLGSDSISIDLTGPAEEPAAPVADAPPVEVAPSSEPPEPADEEGPSGLAVGGWVLVGVGGAMLVTGAITGGMALKLDDQLYQDCPDDHCPDTKAYQDDIDKLKTLSLVTDVMLFVGGAAAATGIVLLIVDATGDEEEGAPVALAPVFGPGLGGAAIQGRF
jgi:hypothetical protein